MKKLNVLTRMLLLVALLVGSTSVWADDSDYIEAYTFSITKPKSNAVTDYTKTGDMEIDGITWNVPGNWYANGALRLGGKSINNVDRTITGKGAITEKITKITVNHSGKTAESLTLNSVTITVASDADFTKDLITKTVTPTISKDTEGSFDLTPDVECPAGRYYKIAFNISNSNGSNYAFVLNSIVFYKDNIKHTLSSAVSPIGAGTVTLGSTSVGEGLTTTISANKNVGYRFLNWTTTSGTITNASSASTTFTMGTSDATVTANFETCETYTISWSVNGTIVSSETLNEGSEINFVAPVSGIPAGYVYKGWSTTEIVTPQQSEPSYITEATCTSDVTYYCVMAKENGTPSSLTKMAAGDKFTSGDKIVFAAIDEDNSFGMYQQTQGSNWIKNFEFTEDVDEIAADNKKWWTVTSTTGGWYIGDATNGRLYSSGSTNLACSTTNRTVFVFEDGNDGTFQLSYTNGSKRYLCCRTDQTGDNKNAFRLSSTDGINKLTLYKYVAASISYSDYATVVSVTKEVSAAGWATYVTPYAVEFSEGDAYVVTDAEASTTLTEVTSVSAGTPVLLKGKGTKTATVIASADDPDSNLLKVSNGSVKGDNKNIYVLADKTNGIGFYLWDKEAPAIPAGKVYLDTTGISGAKGLEFISFENTETDGIRSIEKGKLRIENSDYYNLAGQRVGKDYKGIVIVNGKKMLNK